MYVPAFTREDFSRLAQHVATRRQLDYVEVASVLFLVPRSEVTPTMRNDAKRAVCLYAYGAYKDLPGDDK